jgi:K+-transporting ATPase ATPase A chain
MSRLFQGERTFLHPILRPVEVLVYKLCGIREAEEQRWMQYTASLLSFSLFSFVFVYAFQRLQGILPLNPQGFATAQLPPDLAFNTAVSFTTNTNWQAYSGESTMSYLVQMAALAVQNFTSAAAGIAVALALIRGFARQETDRIGNFWVDVTRATLYILIPLSIVAALVFCSQGVIQNVHPYSVARTIEGATQTIAQGPVARRRSRIFFRSC